MPNGSGVRDPENRPSTAPARPIPHLLLGQKALVTGANSGIGEAVAIALAQAGADVVVNYVTRPEAADAVVERIRSAGREGLAYRADVSKEDEVQNMFREMVGKFGRIDILVNNRCSATLPSMK